MFAVRWTQEAIDDYGDKYKAGPDLESKGVGPAGEQVLDDTESEQVNDSTPSLYYGSTSWFSRGGEASLLASSG